MTGGLKAGGTGVNGFEDAVLGRENVSDVLASSFYRGVVVCSIARDQFRRYETAGRNTPEDRWPTWRRDFSAELGDHLRRRDKGVTSLYMSEKGLETTAFLVDTLPGENGSRAVRQRYIRAREAGRRRSRTARA